MVSTLALEDCVALATPPALTAHRRSAPTTHHATCRLPTRMTPLEVERAKAAKTLARMEAAKRDSTSFARNGEGVKLHGIRFLQRLKAVKSKVDDRNSLGKPSSAAAPPSNLEDDYDQTASQQPPAPQPPPLRKSATSGSMKAILESLRGAVATLTSISQPSDPDTGSSGRQRWQRLRLLFRASRPPRTQAMQQGDDGDGSYSSGSRRGWLLSRVQRFPLRRTDSNISGSSSSFFRRRRRHDEVWDEVGALKRPAPRPCNHLDASAEAAFRGDVEQVDSFKNASGEPAPPPTRLSAEGKYLLSRGGASELPPLTVSQLSRLSKPAPIVCGGTIRHDSSCFSQSSKSSESAC